MHGRSDGSPPQATSSAVLRVNTLSTLSSPFHIVKSFFNNIPPSFDRKGKKRDHLSKPEAPEVIDVPLGQVKFLVPEKGEATTAAVQFVQQEIELKSTLANHSLRKQARAVTKEPSTYDNAIIERF
ncbi:hypothetical protein F4604DRAFT_1684812 [Suillus subluteus]|nr:hypothetical protein F4604DRAFT_1684812 [Suillus subluteus]